MKNRLPRFMLIAVCAVMLFSAAYAVLAKIDMCVSFRAMWHKWPLYRPWRSGIGPTWSAELDKGLPLSIP